MTTELEEALATLSYEPPKPQVAAKSDKKKIGFKEVVRTVTRPFTLAAKQALASGTSALPELARQFKETNEAGLSSIPEGALKSIYEAPNRYLVNPILEKLAEFLPYEEAKATTERYFGPINPETSAERLATNIGALGGTAAGAGGIPRNLAQILSVVGGGAAQTGAQEAGASPGVEALAMLLGSLGGGATGVARRGQSAGSQTPAALLKAQGYETPAEITAPNPISRAAQSFSNVLNKGAVAAQEERVSAPVRNNLTKVAEEISRDTFANHEAFGSQLKRGVQEAEKEIRKKLSSSYEAAKGKIPPELHLDASKYSHALNEFQDSLKESHSLSASEKAALTRVQELKKSLRNRGGRKFISARDAIATQKSLNDIVGEPIQTGAQAKLRGLIGIIRESVEEGASNHPELLKDYAETNRRAAKIYGSLDRPVIEAIKRGDSPEKVINQISTAEDLKDLNAVLGQSSEGKKVFKAARRYVLENIVSGAIKPDGSVDFHKLDQILASKKSAGLISEVFGKEGITTLRNTRTLSKSILKDAKNFEKGARLAQGTGEFAQAVAPLQAVAELMSGNVGRAATLGGGLAIKSAIGKLLSNPAYLEKFAKFAAALKNGDKGSAIKMAIALRQDLELNAKKKSNEAYEAIPKISFDSL